jgi:rifampin ADP-ribosylating transferase
MGFSPDNPSVKYCIQGMGMEHNGRTEEAKQLFCKAWNEAADDLEKFIGAFYMVRHEETIAKKLKWLDTALHYALNGENHNLQSTLPSLYFKMAQCYNELGDVGKEMQYRDLAVLHKDVVADKGPFYHGTKAELQVGDLLTPGGWSNYKEDMIMNHIYFTAIINGGGLAAALAKGETPERVYIVEPTGSFENDPNVTDKKFPGNLTRSYRSGSALKIVGEVTEWGRISSEQLRIWREKLASNNGEIIN